MNLKAKHFVATTADIRNLIRSFTKALDQRATVQADYLKCLVGTTQHEIKAGETDPLKALNAVHDRFYAEVVAIDKDRTGFARSAKSTLQSWMRVDGHDVMKLKAETVTKASLAEETPVRRPRKPSVAVLERRTKKEADRLSEILKVMLDLDRAAARQAIDALVTQFTDLFDETSGARIGRARPKTPARAREETRMNA